MFDVTRCNQHTVVSLIGLISFVLIATYWTSGESGQQKVDNQSSLRIESPIEASGELTSLRDELAQEARSLHALAEWEGKQIFISTEDLPNAATNVVKAISGAVFANPKDVQEISSRLGDSTEAIGKALAKFQQAKLDFASGHIVRSTEETREGLTFANESKSEMAEAVSQTKEIVERSTKVVTGDWDADLAAQIANRIWKERPVLAEGLRQFADVGELSERRHQVLELQHSYDLQISELNRQIGSSTSFAIAAGSGKGDAITNEPGPPSSNAEADPDALTSSEQARRKINEQKMADEILKMRGSQSGASQRGSAATAAAKGV